MLLGYFVAMLILINVCSSAHRYYIPIKSTYLNEAFLKKVARSDNIDGKDSKHDLIESSSDELNKYYKNHLMIPRAGWMNVV
ncbi:hypothetical protein GJ496_011821 [Pomphorhynchus laevis]|nr:hypothetical protein GJ496_011821 [Pomphorhynchus laevis]